MGYVDFLLVCTANFVIVNGMTGGPFLESLINNHLRDCYVMRVSYLENSPLLSERASFQKFPAINVNFGSLQSLEHSHLIKHLGIHQIIQYQQQCVTFLIFLDDFDSFKEHKTLIDFLSNSELQPQGRSSYIILYQSKSNIIQPSVHDVELQNFPNRILVRTKNGTSAIYNFCYYCENDGPGFKLNYGLAKDGGLFTDPMRNLYGHRLRCTAPPAPPLVSLITSKKRPNELEIVGMQEVILKSLANTLNFTFTLMKASGGLTGVQYPNGSWNGIMEEVLSGKADIGLSVATSYERNKVFDFTVPVFNAFLVMVSTKPRPFFNWEAIFYPFTRNAWFAMLVTTVASLIAYRYLHNKSITIEKKEAKAVGTQLKQKKVSTFQATHLTLGALIEQGVPYIFSTLPSRTFAAFWLLISIVITCAYRSKLFLFLTFPTVERPPATFHELSISNYKWGLKSLGGVGLLFIIHSPVAHVRYVGEKLEISTDKYSCLDRTVTEKFVCVIYRAYIDYMMELRYWNIRHKFFISDYLTPPVGSSWVLRKYSPLLLILNKFHSSQFEMGLADKYIDHYQKRVAEVFRIQARIPNSQVDKFETNINFVPETDGSKPLKFANLYGAFLILFFGCGIAVLVLLLEKLQHKATTTNVESLTEPKIRRIKLGASFGLLGRKKN